MVAYSFKRCFVDPIRVGLGIEPDMRPMSQPPSPKRQTIRADRKRHARPGERLQLYCAMRTKHCFLIGEAVCTDIQPIEIKLVAKSVRIGAALIIGRQGRDAFARADGFGDWHDMMAFWRQAHRRTGPVFRGVLIRWEPLP